jgi:hypothetical protein
MEFHFTAKNVMVLKNVDFQKRQFLILQNPILHLLHRLLLLHQQKFFHLDKKEQQ